MTATSTVMTAEMLEKPHHRKPLTKDDFQVQLSGWSRLVARELEGPRASRRGNHHHVDRIALAHAWRARRLSATKPISAITPRSWRASTISMQI